MPWTTARTPVRTPSSTPFSCPEGNVMTSPRIYLFAPLALALAAGGYWLYNANAIQAGGSLAQVPLNSSVSVPPAFVMAVDNSGSMTFQTLFPGQDGAAFWDYGSRATNGYFIGSGSGARLRLANEIEYANGQPTNGDMNGFHHTIPSPRYRIDANRRAIAPIDNFGFARSPDVNPAYFNPLVTYSPWKRPNATNEIVDYPQASITATRVDPDAATPAINVAANWRANSGRDEYFYVPQGATLPAGTVYETYNDGGCGGLTGGVEHPGLGPYADYRLRSGDRVLPRDGLPQVRHRRCGLGLYRHADHRYQCLRQRLQSVQVRDQVGQFRRRQVRVGDPEFRQLVQFLRQSQSRDEGRVDAVARAHREDARRHVHHQPDFLHRRRDARHVGGRRKGRALQREVAGLERLRRYAQPVRRGAHRQAVHAHRRRRAGEIRMSDQRRHAVHRRLQ
ncbi:hypothetical protein [Lysobacter gummosus]|uniref:hypothetical protein n=1 Tax=Lysobacter gummosus TaxID=262324 RepID=UPI00363A1595